jgi:hypothetical protein
MISEVWRILRSHDFGLRARYLGSVLQLLPMLFLLTMQLGLPHFGPLILTVLPFSMEVVQRIRNVLKNLPSQTMHTNVRKEKIKDLRVRSISVVSHLCYQRLSP